MSGTASYYQTPWYDWHDLVFYTSQIHPDGSGWNACGQACLATGALATGAIEAGTPWAEVMNTCSLVTRGYPDNPAAGYTSFAQMEAGFRHYGIEYGLTYDWDTIYQAPWSLLLVVGALLKHTNGTPHTPASWFGGNMTFPDHFVCYCPAYEGAGDVVMNPLLPEGGMAHTIVDSIRNGFGGGYVLYNLPVPTTEPTPPPDPDDLPPARFEALREFGLKPNPAHGGPNLVTIKQGAQGNDTGIRVVDASVPPDPNLRWARLNYGSSGSWYDGWCEGNTKAFRRI